MSDRTSATLFSELFEYLAEQPDERAKEFARKLWKLARGYDFHPCQMDCDNALAKLGLVRIDGAELGYEGEDF